jgi:fluoroquinolone resistance protein
VSRTADDLRAGDSFEDEIFAGLDLAGADLGEKELVRCTFRNMKLSESRWRRARLEDCRFESCDLGRFDPAEMMLREVGFTGCKLMGVDWTELGQFPVMTFTDCNLRYGSFVGLVARKIPFVRCALAEATFLKADLAEARFEDCDLASARFEACDLRGADFAGSHDLVLDPAANRLQGAKIPLETAIALAASFGLKVI